MVIGVEILKVGIVQLNTGPDIDENFANFEHGLLKAIEGGANFILTPEVSNLITIDHEYRLVHAAADENDRFIATAKEIAEKNKVTILIGSLVYRLNGKDKCQNRSFLVSNLGEIVSHYDKIHMFDVNLSASEVYKESDFYDAGSTAVTADTEFGKVGLTICYDIRFPSLYTRLALLGANIITVPAAFTAKTGAKHWEVLLRARAIETGAFILAPAQTGIHGASNRTSYGNSMVVSPGGRVLMNLGSDPNVGCVDINLNESIEYRSKIPTLANIVNYD